MFLCSIRLFFVIGGPRDPLKKRYSLSDSIMHLIEDGEMVKYLRNKSERYNILIYYSHKQNKYITFVYCEKKIP